MRSFGELTQRQQIASLRRTAEQAAREFGFPGSRLSLVAHAYNTTFRLEHETGRYAMRISVGSTRTEAQIAGEVAWVEALAQETDVLVPRPVKTPSGGWLARIANPDFEAPRSVVLYHWLEGRHLSAYVSENSAEKIGQLMSKLHDHGASFRFPAGTERPELKDVIDSLPWRLPNEPLWTDAREEAQAAMDMQAKLPRQVTHFDVHFGNVKIHQGQIGVFDFDDSLMAWPGMDVAQSMFYMRRRKKAAAVERGLWRGLGKSCEDYGLTSKEFEALVAGRSLLLACDLLGHQNAELRAMAPTYIQNTEARLKHWRKAGRFDTMVEA